MLKRLLFVAVLGVPLTSVALAQTDGQLGSSEYILNNIGPSDSSGSGARDYEAGPGGAADLSQHLLDRSISNQGLQRNYQRMAITARIDTESKAVDAVAAGSLRLDLAYIPRDPSANFVRALSRSRNTPPAGLEQFLRDRYAEAAESQRSLGFSDDDMAESCGYFVDSLYFAGQGTEATSQQRDLFRVGCIFDFTRFIASNRTMSSELRTDYSSKQLLMGSIYRYLARHRVPGTEDSARLLFKQLTQRDMSAIPINKFVCTSTPDPDNSDCPAFLARVSPRVEIILNADSTRSSKRH